MTPLALPTHASGAPVSVGVLRATLRIPGARSLKDRRQVTQSLRDRLRQRFDVAVASLEEDAPPTVARLAISTVGGDPAVLERTLRHLREALHAHPGAVVTEVAFEVLRWPSLP